MNFESQLRTKGDHSLLLTSTDYYIWGDNYYGQLGLDNKREYLNPQFFKLPNNEKISFITCGGSHSICLTENNLCYIWGDNKYGKLGLGDTNNRLIPTLFSLPNNEKISFITCGYEYSICLTENNLCYVWGNNENGELGLGDRNNRYIPTLFSLPNNERISFITCGYYHSICLTENNLFYIWGFNEDGQLGLGDRNNRNIPTLFSLPNNERIYFITCDQCHSICLTQNNLCYVWGNNRYGQLGLGDTDARLIPTLFSLPNNERISFITCGSFHSICLTQNNLCYVWGRSEIGELGLGDTNNCSIPTLLTLPE